MAEGGNVNDQVGDNNFHDAQDNNNANQHQQQQDEQMAGNVAMIQHRRITLPAFWEANPGIWFARVEAQFKLSRITAESTKYDELISQVDNKILQQVWDVVANRPAELPYTTMKNATQ